MSQLCSNCQAQLFLAQLPWLLHSNSFGAMLKLQAPFELLSTMPFVFHVLAYFTRMTCKVTSHIFIYRIFPYATYMFMWPCQLWQLWCYDMDSTTVHWLYFFMVIMLYFLMVILLYFYVRWRHCCPQISTNHSFWNCLNAVWPAAPNAGIHSQSFLLMPLHRCLVFVV